ncbi:MAG: MFS transporter [Pseudomonadota bacterium]
MIPTIGSIFGLSSEAARMTLSYGFSGYMVGQLVWGPLSDYIGRSPVVIASLILYALMSLLATLSSTGLELMLVYTAMGFLAATFTSVGNAILKDRYHGDSYVKMVANVGIVMAAGPAFGPGLSGLLVSVAEDRWQMAFYLLSAIGLISLIGYARFARYPLEKSTAPVQSGSATLIFRNGRYFLALFSFSLPFGILISYLATGPYLLLTYYGIGEHQFALWYTMTTALYLLGAVVFRRYSGQLTPVAALYWGGLAAVVGALCLLLFTIALPREVVPGILSLALMLAGIGMMVPAGKAATMGQVTSAFGLGASLMKFLQSACAVGVSAWAAFLFSAEKVIPYLLFYAGICVLAFIGTAYLKKLTVSLSIGATDTRTVPH